MELSQISQGTFHARAAADERDKRAHLRTAIVQGTRQEVAEELAQAELPIDDADVHNSDEAWKTLWMAYRAGRLTLEGVQ